MKRFTFLRLWGSLSLVLTSCAESAIPSDRVPADGDGTDPQGEIGSMDVATTDSPVTTDASVQRVDPPMRDAGDATDANKGDAAAGRDSGEADAGPDAGVRDAAVQDAATDSGSGSIPCSNGQTTCDNVCVNTQTDSKNCGGCGNVCASGQACQSNQCTGGTPDFNVPAGCTKKTLGSHGYAFCVNNLSWADARDACLDAKLDLAIVTDKAESDFVKANGDSWIAVNDRADEGRYTQVVPGYRHGVDGAQASYVNWRSGEPNSTIKCDGFTIPFIDSCLGNHSEDDCVMIYGADGTWNDSDCSQSYSYVCETY